MSIDTKVGNFVRDINSYLDELHEDRGSKRPIVKFKINERQITRKRTPKQQAKCVSRRTSWVCWSSHMANKARHAQVKVGDRTYYGEAKHEKVRTALGNDFKKFKDKWRAAMKKRGLKNAKGREGWYPKDAFHLELPKSKLTKDHRLAKEALNWYARQTRLGGWDKNRKFENKYKELLKPYFKKYERYSLR